MVWNFKQFQFYIRLLRAACEALLYFYTHTVQVLGVGPLSDTSDELNAESGSVVSAVILMGAIKTSDGLPLWLARVSAPLWCTCMVW